MRRMRRHVSKRLHTTPALPHTQMKRSAVCNLSDAGLEAVTAAAGGEASANDGCPSNTNGTVASVTDRTAGAHGSAPPSAMRSDNGIRNLMDALSQSQ